MAIPKIKATYSLEEETLLQLEQLARRWGVSKSEALRRVIRAAASAPPDSDDEGLRSLDLMQQAMTLNEAELDQWSSSIRTERRATSKQRER